MQENLIILRQMKNRSKTWCNRQIFPSIYYKLRNIIINNFNVSYMQVSRMSLTYSPQKCKIKEYYLMYCLIYQFSKCLCGVLEVCEMRLSQSRVRVFVSWWAGVSQDSSVTWVVTWQCVSRLDYLLQTLRAWWAARCTHPHTDTFLLLSTARLNLFLTCIVPSLCCPLLISSCFSFPLVLPVLSLSQSVLLNVSFFVDSFFISFSLSLCLVFPSLHTRLFSLHFFFISPYAAATVRSISDLPGWGFHGDGPTGVTAKTLWWPTLFLIADSPATADGRELCRHPYCIDFFKGVLDSSFAYHLRTFASASRAR